MRRTSLKRQRHRRSPDGVAYANMVHETDCPWCWASGAAPPLERAHLAAGGGKSVRLENRKAVCLLCRYCHECHVHRIYDDYTLSDANMLWLKRTRDLLNYDEAFIRRMWIGNPPTPEEPVWLRAVYEARTGESWK